jgi:IclR family transcriptional regulator, KDG regulon repressor
MPQEYRVPAVYRAVQLLELLAVSPTGLSLAELSRQTGYPKSSLFRILVTLEERSIVQIDKDRNIYMLGMKLIDWGNRALDKIDLKTITHPHLVRVAHETKESYYVGILDDNEVIIIDRADTPEIWRMVARLGQRSPLHATASGQILLSDASDEAVDAIMARTGLKRYTSFTIANVPKLKKRLAQIRKNGYVVSIAEYKADLCVISAPIRDHHGKIAAALMTALQSERARRDKVLVNNLIEVIKREALAISHQIGYQETLQ